jgi:lysozyme
MTAGGSDESTDPIEGANVRPDPPEEADEGVAAPPRSVARPPQPAGLSDAGAAFIARFEGCVLHVHLGKCNGSEPAEFKHPITRARAYQLLELDAGRVVGAIHRFVRVALNQTQFDALCSFGFNCGVGAIQSSGVIRTLNAGNYGGVPAQLMRWVNSGGHPVPGLVRRRRAEGDLFAHGNYGA